MDTTRRCIVLPTDDTGLLLHGPFSVPQPAQAPYNQWSVSHTYADVPEPVAEALNRARAVCVTVLVGRSLDFPRPILAQNHRPHLRRPLSREFLRLGDDDSLFHRPVCACHLWNAPLLVGLRLLQVRAKRARAAATRLTLASRYHSAANFQRALRHRAPG